MSSLKYLFNILTDTYRKLILTASWCTLCHSAKNCFLIEDLKATHDVLWNRKKEWGEILYSLFLKYYFVSLNLILKFARCISFQYGKLVLKGGLVCLKGDCANFKNMVHIFDNGQIN